MRAALRADELAEEPRIVDIVNFLMSQLITFVFLGLAVAGVLKLYRLSTDLNEIKDILIDLKRRNPEAAVLRRESVPASPVNLARAVDDEGMDAAEAYAQGLLKP